MKAFKFSLQTLLDAKEAMEKAVEVRLGEAGRVVEECKRKLRATEKKIEVQVASSEKLGGTETNCHELTVNHVHMEWLLNTREMQVQVIAAKENEQEKIRALLLAVVVERKSLDRLKEKERQKWSLEATRSEQKTMDEYALQGFARNRQPA